MTSADQPPTDTRIVQPSVVSMIDDIAARMESRDQIPRIEMTILPPHMVRVKTATPAPASDVEAAQKDTSASNYMDTFYGSKDSGTVKKRSTRARV